MLRAGSLLQTNILQLGVRSTPCYAGLYISAYCWSFSKSGRVSNSNLNISRLGLDLALASRDVGRMSGQLYGDNDSLLFPHTILSTKGALRDCHPIAHHACLPATPRYSLQHWHTICRPQTSASCASATNTSLPSTLASSSKAPRARDEGAGRQIHHERVSCA